MPGLLPLSPGPACLGFAATAGNPAVPPTLVRDRIGPFFDFDQSRLARLPATLANPARAISYFSYLDTYSLGDGRGNLVGGGAPYAYFSAYKSKNGYNRYNGTDCPTLGVWPYSQTVPNAATLARYHSPESFQIISAGADHVFGPGTNLAGPGTPVAWTPATAGTFYPYRDQFDQLTKKTEAGFDDQASFYDSILGQGTN
jgi:hypothetical protein